jgi:RimJ/RimL family protein N-acetyltransferase
MLAFQNAHSSRVLVFAYRMFLSSPAVSPTIRQLTEFDRPALERHFLSLGPADRRLRFGIALSDRAVRGCVERIDFMRDAVFGATGDDLAIAAAAHLAHNGHDGELGVSVLPEHRQRGFGAALLARAHTHARNLGLRVLFVHCLAENSAMMHIARREGMRIVTAGVEADAFLDLAPADAASRIGEVFEQAVALFDYALKTQLAAPTMIARALSQPTKATADE